MKRELENGTMTDDNHCDDEVTDNQENNNNLEDPEDSEEVNRNVFIGFLNYAERDLVVIEKRLQDAKESLEGIKICRRLFRDARTDKSVVEKYNINQLRIAIDIILTRSDLNTFPDSDPASLVNVCDNKFRTKVLSRSALLSTLYRFHKHNNSSRYVISFALLNHCLLRFSRSSELCHEVDRFIKKYGGKISMDENINPHITKCLTTYQEIESRKNELVQELANEVIDSGFKCLSSPKDDANKYSIFECVDNIFFATAILGISDEFCAVYDLMCKIYNNDMGKIFDAMLCIINYYFTKDALDRADYWSEHMYNLGAIASLKLRNWRIQNRYLLKCANKHYNASDIQGAVEHCFNFIMSIRSTDYKGYSKAIQLLSKIHKSKAHCGNYAILIAVYMIEFVRLEHDLHRLHHIERLLEVYELTQLFSIQPWKPIISKTSLTFFIREAFGIYPEFSTDMAILYLRLLDSDEECFSQYTREFERKCSSHDKDWIKGAELLFAACVNNAPSLIPKFFLENNLIISRRNDIQKLLDTVRCCLREEVEYSNKP